MLDRGREGEAAGIGHYTYYLVKHILRSDHDDEFVLFMDRRASPTLIADLVADHPRVSVRFCPFQALKRHMPFVYSHMVVSAMFDRAKLDLLHAPANTLPLFYRGRSVVTVHDLSVYDHPEWFPGTHPKALSFAERVIVPYSVERAEKIIAVSQRTKQDLQRVFKLPSRRIRVVYEGADLAEMPDSPARDRAALKKHGLTAGKYFLFLGTLEARKNVSGIVRGFLKFAGGSAWRKRHDYDLALAGRRGWKSEPTVVAWQEANDAFGRQAKRFGEPERERVRHLGYLSHDEKRRIMSQARAFVFPSYYEGFGLPVIEAMSLGVPVITSNRGALAEVVGDAALMVDPDDAADLAKAMRLLADDDALARRLGEAGRRRASRFSWRRTANETLAVYRSVLGKA